MNIYLNNRIYEGIESIEDRFANYHSIICDSPHPFNDGQAVVEGVDYEKIYQTLLFNDWLECTKYEYDNSVDYLRRIIALPIEGKEEVSDLDKQLVQLMNVSGCKNILEVIQYIIKLKNLLSSQEVNGVQDVM